MCLAKKVVIFIVLMSFVLVTKQVAAQTYALNNGFTSGQTITTCSGTFFDTGGNMGGYGTNEDYTVTFTPGIPGRLLQFSFDFFRVGSPTSGYTKDTLFAFDGKSTSDRCIGQFITVFGPVAGPIPVANNTLNISDVYASDTNSTGSITFRFVSDGLSTGTEQGWQGNIKCVPACKQKILATIGTSPSASNGYTSICANPTATVAFNAATNYPDNNLYYHQADTSSYFHWYFGDGTDTVKKGLTQIQHTYTSQAGYNAYLIVTDSNRCINKEPIVASIKTGITPIFNIAAPTVCLGDTLLLYPVNNTAGGQIKTVTPVQGIFEQPLPISKPGSLAAANGTGITYHSRLLINQFASGQTLTNINDLLGIVLNIEHPLLQELTISITAPNGATLNLIESMFCNGFLGNYTSLGEPVNNYNLGIVGKGYTYVFNDTPSHGTMWAESLLNHTHSYVDNSGVLTSRTYIPTGSYIPVSPLSALLGTPLNGEWTLSVSDIYNIRVAHLFYWKLDFNPAIFPPATTYTVPITTEQWATPATGLAGTAGTTAFIAPTAAGSYPYTYKVTDAFGCQFDTTVVVIAHEKPAKPNLGADMFLCSQQPTAIIKVTNPDINAFYTWSNGAAGTTITVSTPGTYIVTAQNSWYCSAADTIVVKAQTKPQLGSDIRLCNGQPATLQVANADVATTYTWNNGATGSVITVNTAGMYIVTAQNGLCSTKDTILVVQGSTVTASLGVDTAYCASKPLLLQPTTSNNIASYLWSTGATTPTLPLNAAGVYWLQATAADGCFASDTINIANNPVNNLTPLVDTAICLGVIYTKTVALTQNTTLLWNDGVTGNTHQITAPASYTAIANNKGCLNTLSFKTTAKPVPLFSLGADTTLCLNSVITKSIYYPIASYAWSNGSVDSFITIKQQGLYWAIASLPNNCSFRDSINVQYTICPCQTIVPNAFSPNGDNINDGFKPMMQCIPANYQLTIYNRYGVAVFNTNNHLQQWKGTFNGKPVPVGTYYYIITYTNEGNKQERFAGGVTVLR